MSNYEKEGASVAILSTRGVATISRIREGGAAAARSERFQARSLEASDHPLPWESELQQCYQTLIEKLGPAAEIERLLLQSGHALHRTADESWSETRAILQLTLTSRSRGLRLPILRGAAGLEEIDLTEIQSLQSLLARVTAAANDPLSEIALRPPVSAAIAQALAARKWIPPGVPLRQSTHPSYPNDGDGRRVRDFGADGTKADLWPNRFRPSYRAPAQPALFHVEIRSEREPPGEPAIAALETLAQPRIIGELVVLDALCERDGSSFLGSIEIPLPLLRGSGAAGKRRWFPYGAGCWGRTLVIPEARIRSWG
ncbi:MAG TPA: hypothetical protein VM557_00635 [Thermoanaerobaculia bacterium]|nr:hypothetical protein [Thermoanaerobaculia bacterium]